MVVSLIRQMKYAMQYFGVLMREEDGQDFTEYALILVIVVAVAAAGFAGMGTAIAGVATAFTGWLTTEAVPAPIP